MYVTILHETMEEDFYQSVFSLVIGSLVDLL